MSSTLTNLIILFLLLSFLKLKLLYYFPRFFTVALQSVYAINHEQKYFK